MLHAKARAGRQSPNTAGCSGSRWADCQEFRRIAARRPARGAPSSSRPTGLVLESQPQPQDLAPFPSGLLQVAGASTFTMRGLVPISTQPGRSQISVSQGLTIEDCTLQAPVPPVQVSGMGLAISGRTTGPAVRRNKFLGRPYQPSSGVFGIMASSTADTVATSVDSAEISGNVWRAAPASISPTATRQQPKLRATAWRRARAPGKTLRSRQRSTSACRRRRSQLLPGPWPGSSQAWRARRPRPRVSEAAHQVLLRHHRPRHQAWNALAGATGIRTSTEGGTDAFPAEAPAASAAPTDTIAHALDTVQQPSSRPS